MTAIPAQPHGDVLNQLVLTGRSPTTGQTIASGAGTLSTTTTVDVGTAFSQANINNNFATLLNQINIMRAVLVNAGLMD